MSDTTDIDATDTVSTGAEPLNLADGFAVLDRARWQQMAAAVLNRGRPEDKQFTPEQAELRLQTTTPDGVEIDALYTRPDDAHGLGYPGVMPFVRGATVRATGTDSWQIRQWNDNPDPVATNKAILADLAGGAQATWLQVGADGVAAADLPAALDGVLPAVAPIYVSSHDDQIAAARALIGVWQTAGLEGFPVHGGLGVDRLGAIALGHAEPEKRDIVRLIRTCIGTYPSVRALTVDGTIYHNAGGGELEELACAIATGVAYLRGLEESGVTTSQTFSQIEFRMTASADEFLTIAKLRALRRMWARVGEVSGVPDVVRGARQHAVTSRRMMSRDDPAVNMLRATTACFAAASGGAEAITVLPYDTVWGLPDTTTRRIARNTQVVLAEESNLGRVTDPAGGSWYVEALTDELATKAWALFQDLDADGGMEVALRDGRVTDRIATVRAEHAKRLAHRTEPLTGVSSFPPATQPPLDRTPHPEFEPVGEVLLPPMRDSEVFEGLRDRATAAGDTPYVLLACLGARRDFGARETFTSNLLRVAGIEPVLAENGSPQDYVDAWRAHPSKVVVLCSSPKVYADQGRAVAEALRAAGVSRVMMAGKPSELGAPATPDTGTPPDLVDGSLYDGMDIVDFLSTLLDTLLDTPGARS